MAYSAPTFSVGEVVTAAKMNQIRDSLNFLKGLDGDVEIDAALSLAKGSNPLLRIANTHAEASFLRLLYNGTSNSELAHIAASGVSQLNLEARALDGSSDAQIRMFRQTNSSGVVSLDVFRGNNTSNVQHRLRANGDSFMHAQIGNLGVGSSNAPGSRVSVNGGVSVGSSYFGTAAPSNGAIVQGDVGIGLNNPNGRLHGYGNNGGFIHWSGSSIAGTPQTIVPDGTGDVIYGVSGIAVVRSSAGLVSSTSFFGPSTLVPGGTTNIQNDGGGNVLTLSCSAGGAVTVARSAGGLVYVAALWLVWI